MLGDGFVDIFDVFVELLDELLVLEVDVGGALFLVVLKLLLFYAVGF